MKVPTHVVEERRRQLAEFLQQHAYAPLKEVCLRFGTSEATARRDLAELAARNQIVRTHGGALTEYNRRFASFQERVGTHAAAKRKIAAAAREMMAANTTCFLDSGTTAFAIAQELRRQPVPDLKIVTNSLPVAETLTAAAGIRVYLLGGELVPRQSTLLGKAAHQALRHYAIDQAFLSAESADETGAWNSHSELVGLQQRVLEQAGRNVLCLDASKLKHTAPAFLAPWSRFARVITDASPRLVKGLVPCKVTFT